jgi:hypothetical protein
VSAWEEETARMDPPMAARKERRRALGFMGVWRDRLAGAVGFYAWV